MQQLETKAEEKKEGFVFGNWFEYHLSDMAKYTLE